VLPNEMQKPKKSSMLKGGQGRHRLGLNVIYLNKSGDTIASFSELTATLNYTYTF
jgi:hypothetical protein